MRVRPVVAALLVAGMFGTAACADSEPSSGNATNTSNPIPSSTAQAPSPSSAGDRSASPVPPILAFDAKTLDGQPFSGASLAGRPAVLWFWAPWCPTCAGQADSVAEAARRHGAAVTILGVAGLGATAAMHKFVSDTKVGTITHLDDSAGAVWRRFKITQQSLYVLLDREGKIVHSGWLDSEDLAQRVADLATRSGT